MLRMLIKTYLYFFFCDIILTKQKKKKQKQNAQQFVNIIWWLTIVLLPLQHMTWLNAWTNKVSSNIYHAKHYSFCFLLALQQERGIKYTWLKLIYLIICKKKATEIQILIIYIKWGDWNCENLSTVYHRLNWDSWSVQ